MAGNWKMYKTPAETRAFFEAFPPLVQVSSHCEIVICPPFPDLPAAIESARKQLASDAEFSTLLKASLRQLTKS